MVERVRRIFVAVRLPDEVRLALAERVDRLDLPGRVVPFQNWHITFRFLGEVSEVGYERFLAELDMADLGEPFRVVLGGLGAFPRARNATVVWVGLSRGVERLHELADIAEEAAQTAGLPPNERPFRPHVTLSRVRPAQDVSSLLDEAAVMDFEWRCDSIVVYASHLDRGGARYEPLETLPLSR